MEKQNKYISILISVVVVAILYLIGLPQIFSFHRLAEIFSVIVGCGIFMVAWNARQFQDNNYFLFIGIAYLFVAVLDLAHNIVYQAVQGPNLAAQIRLASRYVESVSFLIAPVFIKRKMKPIYVFLGYILATFLLVGSIFYWPIFPACLTGGGRWTLFAKSSESVICLILLASIALLVRKREKFDPAVLQLLVASILVTIASELTFILIPVHINGLADQIGHSLQAISFYLIYKAIIETGLMKPYHLLFRNLKQSEESLRESKRELTIRNQIGDISYAVSGYKMYREVLEVIMEATQSSYGLFGYINKESEKAVFYSLSKYSQGQRSEKEITLPRSAWNGIWSLAIAEKKTIRSNGPVHLPGQNIPLSGILAVPVIHQEEVIGEVIVADKIGDYTPKDQELLETIVNSKVALILYTKLQKDKQEQERSRAEESIKSAYAELGQIFNTAADGMWVIDKNFTILRVNKTCLKLTGLSRDEVVGKKCYEIFPGSVCHTNNCPMNRILAGEERVEFDIDKTRRDGLEISCIVTATPFRGARGELIGIVEDFKDISRRKEVERELRDYRLHLEDLVKRRTAELSRVVDLLRESELKYSTLVEQARDGVIVIQNGIYKFINKVAAQMTGYSVAELSGQPFLNTVAPESRDLAAKIVYQLQSASPKVPSVFEIKLACKDGSVKDVEISSNFIQYHGQPAMLAIGRDVTERKHMEEELQKVQKLESLGILAGGIAHDFNNLLTAIIGNLSLLESYAKSTSKAPDSLRAIKKASRQAKHLTYQLLTFAKGGAPIKKTFSVSELISETADFALSGSKVRCELFLPDDLWQAEIDAGQISQAINNLVINAAQAMPQGGIIFIGAENTIVKEDDGLPLKEGRYVKVYIKDQGLGIPEEFLSKIFDPYFTTKENGNGLGLFITYSIITKHNGYIRVESTSKVGTTFYIYLPASEEKFFTVKEIVEQAPLPGEGRVLFMDDQPNVRETVKDMLIDLGYEVELASEGYEAIELYEQARESGFPFDAVILDLTVPAGLGGEETVQRLREIDPAVKAIVSSGYSNDPIMSAYQEHGFSEVVAKPYELKELSEVLHKVIEGKEQTLSPR